MVKILPFEEVILNSLKVGKSISQIQQENPDKKTHVFGRIKKLVELGIVEQSGHKKNYSFVVKELPYQVIEKRPTRLDIPASGPDSLIESLLQFSATTDQINVIKERYNGFNRRELAASLGITKLQFNHVIETTKGLSIPMEEDVLVNA